MIKRLHAEFAQILQNPEFQQRFTAMSAEVSNGTTAEFGKRMHDEVHKWPKVVEAMGGATN
jgi:hypothetical protein